MTQTSKIAGALIIAWIVFITTRGELPAYMAMLGIGGGGSVSTPSQCASGSGVASTVGKVGNTLLSGGTTGSTSSTPV